MSIEKDIRSVREGIKAGRFLNEAAVSQGIVLRLLSALAWPTYDTQVVWPENSLGGRRVDFALCHPAEKPVAIIEVKQIGHSNGAERQLFEYAFHNGVPFAILTDGREWNFFLPGEQGDYGERRVYKLDIVDRDPTECEMRLSRYLQYSAVTAGDAIRAAREDYRNIAKERQMMATLPVAWEKLINDEDEMLLEVLADQVESLCGYKPSPDDCAKFLRSIIGRDSDKVLVTSSKSSLPRLPPLVAPAQTNQSRLDVESGKAVSGVGFMLHGNFRPARNAIEVLKNVFEAMTQRDGSFPKRFAGLPKHGRTRRYLALDANDLYPDRPDLCLECSIQLDSGWYLGTNHSRRTIEQIIEMACEVGEIRYGQDLVINLGH